MKGRVAVIAAVVVVGGGGAAWYYARAAAPAATLRFETATVARGRVIGRVTATGTVSALVTVQVGSQVSGRIQKLLVDFNSPVKKGQVIATIDPALFRAAVEQARANHVAAQGNLAKARAQAEDAKRQAARANELFERKLIAPADRDTAGSNAAAAAAQVEASRGAVAQARAALNQATINLRYCTIVSPIDGTVISRTVDVGQTVAAALQAPTLFTIAEDLRTMQVDTNVAESDVGKLEAGMTATFAVDAYPAVRFSGVIRQIRNAPQSIQNVVTYDAVIDVRNQELKLKPGMTANVTFTYADRQDVLRVPNAALRFRPPPSLLEADTRRNGPGHDAAAADGGGGAARVAARGPAAGAPSSAPAGRGRKGGGPGGPGPRAAVALRDGAKQDSPNRRSAWVLRAGKPVKVKLRVGVSDGSFTEITEGDLKAGDVVVLEVIGSAGRGRPPGGGRGGMRHIL